VFLYRFLGRLAACGSLYLTLCFTDSRIYLGTAAAGIGFLPFERRKASRIKEDAMTDPRYTDPRLSDPVIRRDESVGGMWGWIAGVAVLLLIGFLIVAGWNSNTTTASNGSTPATTSSAPMRPAPAPTTTGSGSTAPQPLTPAPAQSPPK
jgi:hypothetical protein